MFTKRVVSLLAAALITLLFASVLTAEEPAGLPEGVKSALPEGAVIAAFAEADLNGDGKKDYAVLSESGSGENRQRELFVITSKDGGFTVAARTKRAVLCSDCGSTDMDPFFEIKALTKTFTILHKFNDPDGGAWGIAAKFGYSRRDDKWQLTYFSASGIELKPADFGLINLEDFDIDFFMASGQVEARPEQNAKIEFFEDDILYTEEGVAFVVRPDGTNKRFVAGDRFYRKISHPNWTADKKEIYYIKNNDVYVMNSDGKNDRKIFKDVLGAGVYRYEDEGKIYRFVRSPDGKKYAVSGYPKNRDYNESNLYIMDSDGKNRKEIIRGTLHDGIASPCWSPDSSKLAYYQGVTLKVMDVNSGKVAEPAYGKGSGLAWSKDGKRILTAVKGAYNIIEVENKSIKEIRCLPVTGQGVLFWSADEKSALTYTSDYVFIINLEEGAKAKTVCAPDKGLIEGLFW